ncbi:MAG: hypothetical protein KKG06_06540 [Bacteroidetes bacterium]|nr:hypothetical protein [Bacteroidota bacterium]
MSKIGYGYGSEWHLLRYLGYHRQYLTDKIISEVPPFQCYNYIWKDVKFSNSNNLLGWENEHKGIDIYSSKSLNDEWTKYWPQTGNVQNWDAVGEINGKDTDEYIFVEAKAHLGEIQSNCGASASSQKQIEAAMQETIDYFGLKSAKVSNWLAPYYQYSNRLAFLHFLLKNNIKAHLLFIYFYGNEQKNAECPTDKLGWKNELRKMYSHLGIEEKKFDKSFYNRVHKIFLSTNPNAI